MKSQVNVTEALNDCDVRTAGFKDSKQKDSAGIAGLCFAVCIGLACVAGTVTFIKGCHTPAPAVVRMTPANLNAMMSAPVEPAVVPAEKSLNTYQKYRQAKKQPVKQSAEGTRPQKELVR